MSQHRQERRTIKARIREISAAYDEAPQGSLLRQWLLEDLGCAYKDLELLQRTEAADC